MMGIEIFLLLIGCIFMIGSFFLTEKLSANELNKIAELSDEEVKSIINREINNAGQKIEDAIDEKIEDSTDTVKRAMEKESNEKIMAISEYSDTIIDTMKKTHDEIMFLYSMLNDKHTELTSLTGDLQRLAAEVRTVQESHPVRTETVVVERPERKAVEETMDAMLQQAAAPENQASLEVEETAPQQTPREETANTNHNERILEMYREGASKVDIARSLGLGLGEVSLVIGLYKGDENL